MGLRISDGFVKPSQLGSAMLKSALMRVETRLGDDDLHQTIVVMENYGLSIASALEERQNPEFPPNVQAVFILAGPGTYFDRLKDTDELWMQSMDRDRIKTGVAMVRKFTSIKKSHDCQEHFRAIDLTTDDVAKYGPLLIYNGISLENETFRLAIDSGNIRVPQNKIFIIDKFINDNQPKEHRHTKDQIESLFQNLTNENSLISGFKNIAILSHAPHFVRIPFYIRQAEEQFGHRLKNFPTFWAYSVKSRPGAFEPFIKKELEGLNKYANNRHLAHSPSTNLLVA